MRPGRREGTPWIFGEDGKRRVEGDGGWFDLIVLAWG